MIGRNSIKDATRMVKTIVTIILLVSFTNTFAQSDIYKVLTPDGINYEDVVIPPDILIQNTIKDIEN